MADSAMEAAAARIGIPFIREAFADRGYRADGKLLARHEPGAVLGSHVEVVEQVLQLVLHQQVVTCEKKIIPLTAQSLCIHGDHSTALASLQAIQQAFEQHQIKKKAFSIC
ncbi:MAG: LamB/YcsF family protein [Saprospiraceae bacterium]|nr:LamB/YcsF family protein [Saprospiraceae bacterium]